jgi:RNA polymerase sigma-70 factor (ECF subfamily)
LKLNVNHKNKNDDAEIIKEYIKNKNSNISRSNNAARMLVEKYRKFVFSIALRYTNSYDDAEDISQDVFIKVFDNLGKFEFKSSLKTWLYRITVNTCLNAKAKKSINNTLQKDNEIELDNVLVGNSNNPEKEYENKEFLERFEKALSKLPERQREVFAMRYFDDMKYEEISEILGLTVGGLKANYYHAVKKLTEMKVDGCL